MSKLNVLVSLALLLLLCWCSSYQCAPVGQLLQITLPQQVLQDFSYVPTSDGYRYSYRLGDGSYREEYGYITNPADRQALMLMMARANRPNRPRGMTKNRKLSPKALQSLAG